MLVVSESKDSARIYPERFKFFSDYGITIEHEEKTDMQDTPSRVSTCKTILKEHKLEPKECVYIDPNEESVAHAKKHKIKAVQYRDLEQIKNLLLENKKS